MKLTSKVHGTVPVASALVAALLACVLVIGLRPLAGYADETSAEPQAEEADGTPVAQSTTEEADRVATILANMTLDEKISQMIVPSFRTWDKTDVTSLAGTPGLAEALQRHQYGGIILMGQNITGSAQVAQLTTALQANNAGIASASAHVPYLTCVDGEGGIVSRFAMGTRMTGSMAVGATGDNARNNALATGKVIGEELAAAGFNVDFAPDIDVNSNPANPVIGTRSFSDDPQVVASLGTAFAEGLAASNVIATYKHFPGHGDTGTDSHLGVSSVTKTPDELKACELVPFASVVKGGADLIMTAHVTLPEIDDEVTFADGSTGYYPATMSRKALTDILRGDLGYTGVVITDALEMDALYEKQLVAGGGSTMEERKDSAEYGANLAVRIIEAGGDMLLMPKDLISADAAQYYDAYIATLRDRAEADPAFAARIDESVTRILRLKEKYGILGMDTSGADAEQKVAKAEEAIGSAAHHTVESDIARQAVTLLKNDDLTLPLSGHAGNVVILGRDSEHMMTIEYAIRQLQAEGLIDADACVVNLESGTTSGSASSPMRITIGHYCDWTADLKPVPSYTDEMRQAVADADAVVAFSVNYNVSTLQPTASQHLALSQIMADAHEASVAFVLLSCNLPYDAARYQDADAIMCCYMAAGMGSDPTDVAGNLSAYNANVVRALESMFDAAAPAGTLPVNVPSVVEGEDGAVSYSGEVLYARGSGMRAFDYAFVAGAGGTYEQGSAPGLRFATNARHDKLVELRVDGAALDASSYAATAGSTNIELGSGYLDGLAAGDHALEAVYDYGDGQFGVSTTFAVTARAKAAGGSNKSAAAPTKPASTASAKTPATRDGLPVAAPAALAAIAAATLVYATRKRQTL